MSENAELWSYTDSESQRRTIINWFERHGIQYNKNQSTEELIQIYRYIECGKIIIN